MVKNETQQVLRIEPTSVSGAMVSANVWRRGVASVAPGGRETVLTLNRKGKVNWMDPTPRFLEPGKEIVFSTPVRLDNAPGSPLVLLQKLLGTGESTNMWYSVDTGGGRQPWHVGEAAHRASWEPDKSERWSVAFRSFEEDGETHVEYVVGSPK